MVKIIDAIPDLLSSSWSIFRETNSPAVINEEIVLRSTAQVVDNTLILRGTWLSPEGKNLTCLFKAHLVDCNAAKVKELLDSQKAKNRTLKEISELLLTD